MRRLAAVAALLATFAAGLLLALPSANAKKPCPGNSCHGTSSGTTGTTTTTVTATTGSTTTGTTVTGGPQPLGNPGAWHLIFDDEFAGTSLNTVWQPNWFGPTDTDKTRPVNNDDPDVLNCYDPSYVSVAGGVLSIRGDNRACTTWDGYSYPYTSGIVNTRGRFDFTYGHLEARVWYPPGTGAPVNWVGFWANGYSWPATGEIDVGEVLGGEVCFNFHYSGGQLGPTCPLNTSGWHTVAADWEPGQLRGFYDGQLIQTWTTGITGAPMYLLVNQDLRTGASLPTTTQVDYVRVWQH